jgi:GNAT superfamily N-acetyltransferase
MQTTEINSDEISIRPAREEDAETLAALVGELGYPTEPATALTRLNDASQAGDCVLVAVHHSKVIGLALLHRTPFLHRSPDGRISTLVVSGDYRSQGVGGRLIEAAESVFRDWQCKRVEVTSGAQREDAHRFYLRAGYTEQPKRFIKELA